MDEESPTNAGDSPARNITLDATENSPLLNGTLDAKEMLSSSTSSSIRGCAAKGKGFCLNGAGCLPGLPHLRDNWNRTYGDDTPFAMTMEMGTPPDSGGPLDVETSHCACPPGFVGKRCEFRVEVCPGGDHVCFHGGVCVPDGSNTYICRCPIAPALGYNASEPSAIGSKCQHVATESCEEEVEHSRHAFCTNHGKCVEKVKNGEAHLGCKCPKGFGGDHCEIVDQLVWGSQGPPVSPLGGDNAIHLLPKHCPPSHALPCRNHGKCVLETSLVDPMVQHESINGMVCICPPHSLYEGPMCGREIRPNCHPEEALPCEDGGVCRYGFQDFNQGFHHMFPALPANTQPPHPHANEQTHGMHCLCPANRTGTFCQFDMERCEGGHHACLNGGLCGDDGLSCKCHHPLIDHSRPAVAGSMCEHVATTSCEKNRPNSTHAFCTNHGKCEAIVEEMGVHLGCRCPPGFAGKHCEIVLEENEAVGHEVLMNDTLGSVVDIDPALRCKNINALQCLNGGACAIGYTDFGIYGALAGQKHPGWMGKNHNGGGSHNPMFHQNGMHCVCPTGFTGLRCEMEAETCGNDQHLCFHGGACLAIRHPTQETQYICKCNGMHNPNKPGLAGDMCEHMATTSCNRLNPHHTSHFCTNGGTCLKITDQEPNGLVVSHPGCQCPEGFAGVHCEIILGASESGGGGGVVDTNINVVGTGSNELSDTLAEESGIFNRAGSAFFLIVLSVGFAGILFYAVTLVHRSIRQNRKNEVVNDLELELNSDGSTMPSVHQAVENTGTGGIGVNTSGSTKAPEAVGGPREESKSEIEII